MKLRELLEKNNLKQVERVQMHVRNLDNMHTVTETGMIYHRDAVLVDGKWTPGDTVFVPDVMSLDEEIDISELRCAARPFIESNNRWWKSADVSMNEDIRIGDIYNTLTDEQKEKMYCIVGQAVEHPESIKNVNLDFLSTYTQRRVVGWILEEVVKNIKEA